MKSLFYNFDKIMEGKNQNEKNPNKIYQEKTDQDLMLKMNLKLEKELREDLENGEERVILEDGEDYKEIDGVRFTPFSLTKELKEGSFKDGKYMDNSEEEDVQTYSSSSEDEAPKVNVKEVVTKMIEKIKPQNTVTDALIAADKDKNRMVELTDLATQLMFVKGFVNIYSMTLEDLQEKLDKFDEQKQTKPDEK